MQVLLGYIIFIIILILPIKAEEENITEGEQALIDILAEWDTDNKDFFSLVSYTGSKFNDLGDYDAGMRQKRLTYGTITITNKTSPYSIFTGYCLPNKCNQNDFEQYANLINDYLEHNDYEDLKAIPHLYCDEKAKVGYGNEAGVLLFGTILGVIFFGVLTEYSPIFDIKDVDKNLPVEKRKNNIGLFFLSFSLTKNAMVLFNTPSPAKSSSLKIFDGIRVISLGWAMLGHSYSAIMNTPITNLEEIKYILMPWSFGIIQGAYFAADTFLFMSAFLGSYLLLVKYFEKTSMNYSLIYFHRVYRLFPPLILFLLMYMTFFQHIGDGPVWAPITNKQIDNGQANWWTHFLFISNILPWAGISNGGLPWLWYISVNLQLYLCLPFQISIYRASRSAGYIVACLIMTASIITTFVISQVNNLSILKFADDDYAKYLFRHPWVRIHAYQVGVILGIMYYEWKNKNKNDIFANSYSTKIFQYVRYSKIVRYSFLIIGIFIMTVIIFLPQADARNFLDSQLHFSVLFSSFYNALCRPLYTIALSLILLSPLTGHNEPMRFLLGGNGYVPWAKLTYMAYILHYAVFTFYYDQVRQGFYLSHKNIFLVCLASIFVSYIMAIPFTCAFELPFLQMERLLLFPKASEKFRRIVEETHLRAMTNDKRGGESLVKSGNESLDSRLHKINLTTVDNTTQKSIAASDAE